MSKTWTPNYPDEYTYLLQKKFADVLATSSTWVDSSNGNSDYDAYYVLVRNGADAPKYVFQTTSKDFGSTATAILDGANDVVYKFADSTTFASTADYGGTSFALSGTYTANEAVTIIEFRGGVATNAPDLNTTKLAEIKLYAEGNPKLRPQQPYRRRTWLY